MEMRTPPPLMSILKMENLVKTLTSKTISFFKSKNSHIFHRESKTTETPVNHTQSLIEVMKMMSVPEAGPKQKNSLLHQDDSFQSTKLRSLVHHFTSVRVMSKLRRRKEKKREGDEIECLHRDAEETVLRWEDFERDCLVVNGLRRSNSGVEHMFHVFT
ncbi:hypothetical protein C5167_029228 [Papaver somniferum]|nr:hypothetical protein C5167_029228 [Papaver somniferum]